MSDFISPFFDLIFENLKASFFAIIWAPIAGIIIERLYKIQKVKEKYFEVYKNLDDISPPDFNIAEYREYYYKRKENDLILKELNKGNNIIITGKPKSGKTRAAYESLMRLKGFKIIKFWSNRPIELEEIPNRVLYNKIIFKSKIIVFIDDLDKYIDKLNIDHLIKKLDLNTKEYLIIATCRTGIEYKNIKEEFNENIKDFNEISLEDISDNIAKNLSLDQKLNLEDFDGTIGSLFLGLEDMKTRYEGLSDEYHVLFRIIKLFNDANTFIIDKNVLKKVYLEKIKGELFPSISFDGLIKNLEENSLIVQKKEHIRSAHDCYLNFAEYNANINDLKWLREILIQINDLQGLFDLGGSFYHKKLYEDSLICYNIILLTTVEYSTINNKGINLYNLRRLDEALDCFNKAIRMYPNIETAYNGKGDVLKKMGKLEEALKCYNKSLEINPQYYIGLINKGSILSDLGKFDESLNCFEDAIAIDSKNNVAFYNKGVTLMDINELNEALECLDKSLELFPEDFDSLIAKGQILMDMNRNDEALESINIIMNSKTEIEDEKTFYNVAQALSVLNKRKCLRVL